MPPDVLVVGSLHLDIVVRAQALPAIDETARGSSWKMVCGGKGGNQAVWAARLGAKTAMISRIGKDDFGRQLLANLNQFGVETSGVSVDPQAGSGMSVAIVQDNGEYGAVIVSGSNLAMNVVEVLASFHALGMPRIVVLQNEIEESVNMALAKEAKTLGCTVLLNAAPARALGAELASYVDILVVNRVEAAMMSGMPVSTSGESLAAAAKLGGLCDKIIVTLGGMGLILCERGRDAVFIEALQVKAVSTHGAGDCFVGQLAQALASEKTVLEAARLANETAAAFVCGKLS